MIRSLGSLVGTLVTLSYFTATPPLIAQRCGVERWSVKTGTDADVQRVDLSHPKSTTIAELIALPPPHPIPPQGRFGPTETTVFVVNATLTDYKFEGGSHGDSDYHLVLQDAGGNTMVVEIPSPTCVGSGSPFAAQIASSRAAFDAKFMATSSFQTANVPVQVVGVGMFDFPHGQHGAAPNVIELHPVLNIVFNPQAQGPEFIVSLSSQIIHVSQGGSSSITISTSSSAAAAPNVELSTSDPPAGVTSHITPLGGGTSTLALTVSAAASTGSFPFTITGTAGGRSHSQTVSIEVTGSGQTPVVQEWEYQVISATSQQDVIDQANKLGAQDWEMVSVVRVQGSPGWRAFFKRVKREF